MKKRNLFFVRDTLSSDKKNTKDRKIEKAIRTMRLNRQLIHKITNWIVRSILIISSLILILKLYNVCKEFKENVKVINIEVIFDLIISMLFELVTLILSLISSIIVIKKDTMKAKHEYDGSFITNNNLNNVINEKIVSTEKYKNEEYKWEEYKDKNGKLKKYETSNKINQFLIDSNFSDSIKINIEFDDYSKKKFVTPEDSLRALDYKVKEKIKQNELIFNNDLVKLSTDICNVYDKEKEFKVRLQKTDYFSNISTNDCIYNTIKKYDDLNYKIEGYKFGLKTSSITEKTEKVELYNLDETYCSNIIGMSTLAITKDNKIVILKQGNANESKFQLVPSGSGSAEYNTLIQKKNYCDRESFTDYITYEMAREMLEEIQVSKCNYKIINKGKNKSEYNIQKYTHETYLIGYCRLLHRAGKPDFFGITKLDLNSSILEKYFEIYTERKNKEKEKKNQKKKAEIQRAYFINQIKRDEPFEDIQRKIREKYRNDKEHDIFICCKEVNELDKKNEDLKIGRKLYNKLVEKEYKVLCPSITLKENFEGNNNIKESQESSKIIIMICTNKDDIQNETFKKILSDCKKNDNKDKYIILYNEDVKEELPREVQRCHLQNLNEINYMDALIDKIDKILEIDISLQLKYIINELLKIIKDNKQYKQTNNEREAFITLVESFFEKENNNK